MHCPNRHHRHFRRFLGSLFNVKPKKINRSDLMIGGIVTDENIHDSFMLETSSEPSPEFMRAVYDLFWSQRGYAPLQLDSRKNGTHRYETPKRHILEIKTFSSAQPERVELYVVTRYQPTQHR